MERDRQKNMATTIFLTVLLTIALQVNGYDYGEDYFDMEYDPHGTVCPIGTVFCLKTLQCVNSESPHTDPCPLSPNCKKNEVKQWKPFEGEKCVNFKTACGGEMNFCKRDGELQCDHSGSCDSVEAFLSLQTSYDSFVDTYDSAEERTVSQLAAAAGVSEDDVWIADITRDVDGNSFTNVHSFLAPHSKSMLNDFFSRQDEQIFTDANYILVPINWAMSWMKYHPANDYYNYNNDDDSYDNDYYECIHCGPDEVFCLETMSCRKTSGSCPVIDDCDEGWNKCFQMDGSYHCVSTDQCSHVQVIIALRIDDFGTFVGENYMHYYQQLEALTNSLVPANDPHHGMIWNASIWRENDTLTWFHGWIAEELHDTLSSSLSTYTLNLYDMYGMGLSIDWYQSHVYSHPETPNECEDYQQKCFQMDGSYQCVSPGQCYYDEDDDSYDNDYHEYIHCGPNEVFCLETMSCRTTDGFCPVIEDCDEGWNKCLQMDGSYHCVSTDQCSSVQVIIALRIDDFGAFVGENYMYYYQQLEALTNSLVPANDPHHGMIWNASIWHESDTLTWFHGWIAEELYDTLSSSLSSNTLNLYDMYGMGLSIDWYQSHVYYHQETPDECEDYQQKCFQDGFMQCVDTNTCRHVEVYFVLGIDSSVLSQMFGPDYYDVLFTTFIQLFSQNMAEVYDDNMFWNLSILEENSQVKFHFWAAEELFQLLSNIKTNEGNGILSDDISQLLDWTSFAVWFDGETDNENDGYEGYEGIVCGPTEVFCLETNSCYTPDASCDTDELSDECNDNMVKCHDGDDEICVPAETCASIGSLLSRFTIGLPEDGTISIVNIIQHRVSIKEFLKSEFEMEVGTGNLQTIALYPAALNSNHVNVYAEFINTDQQKLESLKETVSLSIDGNAISILDATIMPLQNLYQNIYVLSVPVVANVVRDFSIEQVMPVGALANAASSATLDCSETSGVQVFTENIPLNAIIYDVSMTDTISLEHSLTESMFVKCKLFNDQDEYYMGFLAIPEDIPLMGGFEDISTTQMSLDIDEDSDWMHLPPDMFHVSMKGEGLYQMLNTWGEMMTSNQENWINYGSGISMLTVFENYAIDLFGYMFTNIESFSATVTTDLPSPQAKFRYRDEPMDGNTQINILKHSGRVSMLLEENYFGEFNLIINSVATGINLLLPVNVLGSPDSPALNTDFNFEGYSQFAYPLDDAQVPEFIVKDVASIPFHDVDGDDLGLLVVGYVSDSFTVEGNWEYSDDGGDSWTEIVEAMVPDGDTGTVTALRLEANYLLRFTPGLDVMSWSLVAAPSLAVYAFDGTDEITDLNDDITISKCSLFGGDKINQYCMDDGKASYSEDLAVIPLARYDCNNDLTDGMQELACGCGDATSCLDCHGAVNGGAVVDICGVCGGDLLTVDCSDNACLENRKEICDLINDEVGDVEDPVCGAGETHKCGECLPDGVSTVDDCGDECGSNSCLDCANVVYGNSMIDTCGVCSTPDVYNVGCVGIGNIQPEFVFYYEADAINMNVLNPDFSDAMLNAQNTGCSLDPVAATGNVVALTDLGIYGSDDGTYQLTAQLDETVPISTLVGQYYVSCQIDDVSITSEPQKFTIFGFPTVQSITPSSYEFQEIYYNSYAVIRGEGFRDTGYISLVVPCSEVQDDCDANAYVGVEGFYINETAVGASLGKLKQSNKLRGQIYHVSVLLYDWRQHDLPSGVDLSSVEFEVKVPAPEATSAKKSKYGCSKIVLSFNMRVVVETTEPTKCNTFLQDFADNAVCTWQPYGDSSILIEYTQDTSAWTAITVIDNRIKNADDYSNSPRYFTGSVDITTDELEDSEQPIVGIDGATSVGCKGTVLKPSFKNLGCFQPTISWSVTSDSADPTDTDDLITNPDEKVQEIFPTQLSDGVTYEFTMAYSVGSVNGSESITLVKSSDATPILEISGVNDGFDTTQNNVVKADIKLCGDNLSSNIEVGWTVTTTSGDAVLLGKGKVFNIKKDKLNPEYQYTITGTLFYDGVEVNVDKTFTTASEPIDPIIMVNGIKTRNMEVDVTETFTLKCLDGNNENLDPSKYSCTWTCKSNQQTTGMSPVANPDGSTWISHGQEIIVPATLYEDIPEYDYKLIYKLTIHRGNEAAQSTVSITHRSALVLGAIQEPEILIHVKDHHEVTDNNANKILDVHCGKATRYSWTVNDGESDHGKPINVPAYLINSVAAQAIAYHDTALVDCGIKLNLASLEMVPATTYYIKLSVYNEQGSYVRTESHIFTFIKKEMPVPGTLDLTSTEDPPIAMKTIFKLVMVGWPEEVGLKCFGYYKSATYNEPYHRLNAIEVSPSAGIPTFSLPEGEFEFYVECEDDNENSISAVSGFTVTVQSASPLDIFTSVIGVLPVRITIEIETVIATVSGAFNLFNSVDQSAYSNNEIASANTILHESTNMAITTTIDNCHDQLSLVVALEMSVDLVIQAGPTIVSVSTRIKIVATASQIAQEAIGGGSFGRRRKREVTGQVESSEGLTQQEAIVLLQTFDAEATLSNDTLNATQAIQFRDAIDDIMVALCLGYSGVTSIEAPSTKSYISVYKTDMLGFDTDVYSISSDTVNSDTLPGKIVFGSGVTDSYGGVWECMTNTYCNEVFIGVGIIKVDTYTPAAGIEAPTRISDIYIARILNSFLYQIENVNNLANPALTTITIYEQVNETAYDYKCKMWLNDAWDESVCTTSAQASDAETSNFYVECSCTELGVLAVFQELKEIETLSLDSTTTSTTTTTTTAPLPSVNLQPLTSYLNMTFSFIENFFDFLTLDPATQAVFNVHIRDQVVSLTQYPTNSFQNWAVSEGSIVVSFELHESGSSPTLGQMAYVLEDLFSSGNVTLTSPNGTTLTIIPGSFAYQEISNSGGATEDSSESSNLAVAIGGAVAGVVIAILIVVIVVLVLKQKGIIKIGSSHGSVPDDPPPRYEMPSPSFHVMPARPPPYIYDPVKESKAQKWIENEVEKKVAQIKEEEEKRPISSSSGGTTETGLPSAGGIEKKDVVPSVSH